MTDMMLRRDHVGPRFSQIVRVPAASELIFLAGQLADDRSLDIEGQSVEVLRKIDRYLAEAGSDKTKIVSAMIWLMDMDDYDGFNTVWDAWVPTGQAPVRACVQSQLARADAKIEVQVYAVA